MGILSREEVVKLEIEGVKRGLEWLYQQVKSGKKITINPKQIQDLHKLCFGWIFPDWAGRYRTIQVTYSGKEAPSFFKVPELIVNLCMDLQERLKYQPAKSSADITDWIIDLLAWFQHQFVVIHPFQDYNGRMARLLTNIILLNLGYPPLEIDVDAKDARSKYLSAMQKADDGDFNYLNQLILAALTEALENVSKQ